MDELTAIQANMSDSDMRVVIEQHWWCLNEAERLLETQDITGKHETLSVLGRADLVKLHTFLAGGGADKG